MFNGISDDGKVLGVTVLDVKELPAEKSVIVLLDHMEMGEGPARNPAKFRDQGELVWIAELPGAASRECYVSVDFASPNRTMTGKNARWAPLWACQLQAE
ncbi:hypothetical protein D7Z96_01120 [Pseudarthrobacter phenanthrenivorans]|uniref:Uncharacterized protein n=1 Tax=Pseudarthrobacter phenanthrenivorans TaxID=361575 RepID=A0A3B0GBN6_PSEPS|nr:hypothetical protein [Pseudarthrobacter phenanthrenivorans]RKO27567.1 hypothetical protein D7Z96_01120 [Pseudarthrobacter phenanthrenivorans]